MVHAQAIGGRPEEARRGLDRLTGPLQTKYVSPYEIGLIHEALGNSAQAPTAHS